MPKKHLVCTISTKSFRKIKKIKGSIETKRGTESEP